MADAAGRGEIITFYSYKGGTGRTMALANVACVLAGAARSENREVLMIDWDLEAPGLHKYFRPSARERQRNENAPGLLELFESIEAQTRTLDHPTETTVTGIVENLPLEAFILPTDIPGLLLMKAGRFNDSYSARASRFPWSASYERVPSLIPLLAERLSRRYRWVLIDSRTGITDTSGICTVLLPDRLAIVFTPNEQSLTGIKQLVQAAAEHRLASSDLRPLSVFPLPSRIDASEPDLRRLWRHGDGASIRGYQPLFERLFRGIYALERCDLKSYFDDVQIQHVSKYAYGEQIAMLQEDADDRFSIARSYATFAERLASSRNAWDSDDRPRLQMEERAIPWTRRHRRSLRLFAAALLGAFIVTLLTLAYYARIRQIEAEHRAMLFAARSERESADLQARIQLLEAQLRSSAVPPHLSGRNERELLAQLKDRERLIEQLTTIVDRQQDERTRDLLKSNERINELQRQIVALQSTLH